MSVYLELTKPRITLLVLITTLAGFYLGSLGSLNLLLLLHTLIGTALTAGGASALNMVLERDVDSRMRRTKNRPIPSGRLQCEEALLFGIILSASGIFYLTVGVNLFTGLIASLTLYSYLFLYTPLKRTTPFSTLIGAIPGALPPVMGWSAARGEISLGAWVLFSILFLWQLPHFLALAWLYREDYARAGFPMLPVLDPDGERTGRHIALYCLALIPVSLAPTLLGLAGPTYFFGALALGLVFFGFGLSFLIFKSKAFARRLFRTSVIYLPLLLILMMLNKI
ncbi:protoheme IX farnesyltransferase [candidate division TA06 bacterium]|nr:protoheme IX farnesyltransferase [candidate division TA06 bacterium]